MTALLAVSRRADADATAAVVGELLADRAANAKTLERIVEGSEFPQLTRSDAARMVIRLVDDPGPLLAGWLQRPDTRQAALDGLAAAGPRACGAIEQLRRVSGGDCATQTSVARAMWRLGFPRDACRVLEQVLKNCLDTEREGAYALVEQMRSEAVSLGVPLRALLSAAPSPRASLVAALGAVEEDSIASAALFTQVLLSSEDPGASREALTALWARPMTGRDEVRRLVATLDDCDSGSLLHEDLQLLLENRSTDEWGWLLEPGRAVGRAGRALLLRAIGTCGGDSAPVMDFLIRGLGAEDEDVLEAAFEALVGLSERRVALPSGVAELAMARAVAGGGTEVRRLCLVSLSYSSRPSHEVADAALRAVWDPESPFWDATALLIESREYREALGRAFASLERNRRGEVAMRLAGSSGLGKPSAALAKALLRAEPDELVQLSLLRTWAVLEEGPALSSELLGLRTALLPAARADAARLRFHVTGERDASLRDVMGVLDGLSSADAKVVAIDALVSLGDLDGDARAALDRLIADRTQPEHVREAAASAKVGRRSPGGGR